MKSSSLWQCHSRRAQFIFIIFQFPVALAPNIGIVIVTRFIAGLAGIVPLTVTSGSVADVFEKDASGNAMALFALAGCFGPAFGPYVACFLFGLGEGKESPIAHARLSFSGGPI